MRIGGVSHLQVDPTINGINGNKWKTPFDINGIMVINVPKLQVVINNVINGIKWEKWKMNKW